jgi:osmotically-inducible protein OsmY
MQSEQPLDSQISAALAQDSRTAHAVIDVACVGGQVTLAGAVRSAEEKAAAQEIAKRVAGVVTVDNDLTIQSNAPRT